LALDKCFFLVADIASSLIHRNRLQQMKLITL
jgi:hypothetical protein